MTIEKQESVIKVFEAIFNEIYYEDYDGICEAIEACCELNYITEDDVGHTHDYVKEFILERGWGYSAREFTSNDRIVKEPSFEWNMYDMYLFEPYEWEEREDWMRRHLKSLKDD